MKRIGMTWDIIEEEEAVPEEDPERRMGRCGRSLEPKLERMKGAWKADERIGWVGIRYGYEALECVIDVLRHMGLSATWIARPFQ
ncbi:hypothetical protein Tco_0514963 [Tanacetum coccineum]